MKKDELTTKSPKELLAHAASLREQIAQTRFALRSGSEKQSHKVKVLRKELAQTLTMIANNN